MAQVYHIRTINGQVPPIPKSLEIDEYTLDSGSFRSASGLLNRTVIGKKVKFNLVFTYMNKTELQALLSMFNSNNFTVTYEDLIDSSIKSGQFYHGDIKVKPLWIKNEANTDVLFDTFSINLIEY